MARVLLLLLLLMAPASAQRFVVVAFHDVADSRDQLTADAVTSSTLVTFFDWLKAERWNPVSLDDIAAAREGRRPLPERAILITFDDGYRSTYTRVFPLLLAYRYPAVVALVGAWMDVPAGGTVTYGDQPRPREDFITWAEAREMQASGLVEFASHSYGLHSTVLGNPQGNLLPAAAAWAYDATTGRYEDDAALRRRVDRDLRRAAALMRRELGRAPRALVWPFGRYSGPALEAAQAAGFRFTLTLDPEPADAQRPLTIGRFYPSQAPDLAALATNLRFRAEAPPAMRLLCLDPGVIAAAGDMAAQDEKLGQVIEAIRLLGPNLVALDGHARMADGSLGPAWYPSRFTPSGADILGRLVWQIRTRGGADAYVRLSLDAAAASLGEQRIPDLVTEMLRHAPADGLMLEGAGGLAAAPPGPPRDPAPWVVRQRRAQPLALDQRGQWALMAMRRAEALRPGLRLMVTSEAEPLAGTWPAPLADLVLRPQVALGDSGWAAPAARSRLLLDLADSPRPVEALRSVQATGVTGLAYCEGGAAALADAARRGPAFSSAAYPLRP
ncbi:MAG: poly-beta-1,6-N-acetyl-D-glucosamine N-deacetylase PgaB [Roseococcus sp.]